MHRKWRFSNICTLKLITVRQRRIAAETNQAFRGFFRSDSPSTLPSCPQPLRHPTRFDKWQSRARFTFDRLGAVDDCGHGLQHEERAPKATRLALHLIGPRHSCPLHGGHAPLSGPIGSVARFTGRTELAPRSFVAGPVACDSNDGNCSARTFPRGGREETTHAAPDESRLTHRHH